jgi:hypothetical protein
VEELQAQRVAEALKKARGGRESPSFTLGRTTTTGCNCRRSTPCRGAKATCR